MAPINQDDQVRCIPTCAPKPTTCPPPATTTCDPCQHPVTPKPTCHPDICGTATMMTIPYDWRLICSKNRDWCTKFIEALVHAAILGDLWSAPDRPKAPEGRINDIKAKCKDDKEECDRLQREANYKAMKMALDDEFGLTLVEDRNYDGTKGSSSPWIYGGIAIAVVICVLAVLSVYFLAFRGGSNKSGSHKSGKAGGGSHGHSNSSGGPHRSGSKHSSHSGKKGKSSSKGLKESRKNSSQGSKNRQRSKPSGHGSGKRHSSKGRKGSSNSKKSVQARGSK